MDVMLDYVKLGRWSGLIMRDIEINGWSQD